MTGPMTHMSARRRARWLGVSMLTTFVLLRASLMLRPNADLNVAGYNVHHLYTGLLAITVCSIWIAVMGTDGRLGRAMLAGLGVGLGCALDEWVYLIVTDGTNAAYLTPASLWGGVVMVGAALGYAASIAARGGRSVGGAQPTEQPGGRRQILAPDEVHAGVE